MNESTWLKIEWDKVFITWRQVDFSWLPLNFYNYSDQIIRELKENLLENLTAANQESSLIFDVFNSYEYLWRSWQHVIAMILEFFKKYSMHKLLLKNKDFNINYAKEVKDIAAELAKVSKEPEVMIFWALKIREAAEDLLFAIEKWYYTLDKE